MDPLAHTSNISFFLEEFTKSTSYKDAFANYYKGKTIFDDVTDEERIVAFLSSNLVLLAIVDFNTKTLNLTYEPDNLPRDSGMAIQKYINIVSSQLRATTKDEIIELDAIRSIAHQDAATALIEDRLCKHYDIAKAVARLILVDLDLDTPESVRVMKLRRLG